jgi:hypothetical protein
MNCMGAVDGAMTRLADLLCDPVLSASLRDSQSCFALLQDDEDLFFAVSHTLPCQFSSPRLIQVQNSIKGKLAACFFTNERRYGCRSGSLKPLMQRFPFVRFGRCYSQLSLIRKGGSQEGCSSISQVKRQRP